MHLRITKMCMSGASYTVQRTKEVTARNVIIIIIIIIIIIFLRAYYVLDSVLNAVSPVLNKACEKDLTNLLTDGRGWKARKVKYLSQDLFLSN